jgi:hypothetical protein
MSASDCSRRMALAATGSALGAAILGSGAGDAAAPGAAEAGDRDPRLRPDLVTVAAGGDAELVKTIQIRRRAARSRTVAMSLKLPDLHDADRIKAIAELTITATCFESSRRCIGRRYRYSPRAGAQLRLARRRGAASRRGSIALSKRRKVTCGQRRPNRNHHCALVFADPAKRLPAPRKLPCRPDLCHLNLVLDAHHRHARPGNRLIVGTDRPNGSVAQDRGRLSAIVFQAGFQTPVLRNSVRRPRRRHLSMGDRRRRKGSRAVIYSAPVPELQRDSVISAEARQRLGIGHLPYSAFVGTELILSSRRAGNAPNRVARRSVTQNGHLTERSGFNCTQGPSAFRTPCKSHRAGTVRMRREPRRDGRVVPLYVNLVSRTFPKRASAKRGDRAKILRGGGIDVVAYPLPRP